MFRIHGSIAALTLAAALLCTATASAQDFRFKPWSDITDVCPSCEQPAGDVISLKNGDEIKGVIRAINPLFYTVERFGEVRTVPTNDVQSVEWKRGTKPDGLDSLDQIVLSNGHVLTGKIITDNDRPPYFEIESSYLDHTYTVFKSQAQMVFKKGIEYDFRAAMKDVKDVRE